MTATQRRRMQREDVGLGPDEVPLVFRLLRSTVGSAALLLAIYASVVALSDLGGNIGSDVGGKTATLDALVESGSLDLGYWASDLDPDGSVHPMFRTARFGDEWVNVTTLPMLLLAWPLAEIGGLSLAMMLPMFGSVAAALAARRMSRDLGNGGTLAFWAVGLGSPAAFYATTFWEHSIGLGLMAWGMVTFRDALDGGVRSALLSGLLFGVAAVLRQEALVYGFVAGIVLVGSAATGWTASERRSSRERWSGALASGTAMAGAAVAMLLGNRALEGAILGETFRDGRTAGAASSFGSGLGRRWNDAILTTLAPFGSVSVIETVVGLVLIAAIAAAVVQLRRAADARRPLVVAGIVYLLIGLEIVVNGLSFVPALLIVSPLAIVGAALGVRDRRAYPLLGVALGSMPLVWMAQYSAGMAAQWGGRYLLLSGWILIVLACGLRTRALRPIVAATAAVGFAASALGAVWTVHRTDVIASASAQLALVDAEVVVFNSSLDARQTGSVAVDGTWLAADNADALVEVLDVLAQAGVDQFAYVDVAFEGGTIDVDGFEAVGEQRIDYLGGFQYRVTTFDRAGS